MKVDLLQGSLDMLVLKSLTRGPKHGYQVARWLEEATEAVLTLEEGTLYPALHRLHGRGLVEAEWGVSENNRRAKYYRLTAAGRRELVAETRRWTLFATAVSRAMDLQPA
jgi:PadR family transcriptional regulator PadR